MLISGSSAMSEAGQGAFQEMPQARMAGARHEGVVDGIRHVGAGRRGRAGV